MRFIFFVLLIYSIPALSQQSLKGVVSDQDNKPIPGASVFLNNTSLGTRTNDEGKFELFIPAGKFDLIVSSIGYETFNKTITSPGLDDFIPIKLKIKEMELDEVIVGPYEKDGWEKWGTFFLQNFIGTSANANQCRIKNSDIIKFRNSKKRNELTAYAFEPLVIENKALGYTIQYQMEAFNYNFGTHFLFYEGYPFFENMKGNPVKKGKWEKRRSEAYSGSVLHFMRSVYRNRIIQEGFEVHPLQKIPNLEKRRVKMVYERNTKRIETAIGQSVISVINEDSADYYNRVLREEDYIDVIGKNILPGDSIAYAADSVTAGLYFENYLLVIYKNKKVPFEYLKEFPQQGISMTSQISLQKNRPVVIELNGSYYDPADLVSLGYWAWSEKMARMLPFDYQPLVK